jgi:hypothetical protein
MRQMVVKSSKSLALNFESVLTLMALRYSWETECKSLKMLDGLAS